MDVIKESAEHADNSTDTHRGQTHTVVESGCHCQPHLSSSARACSTEVLSNISW